MGFHHVLATSLLLACKVTAIAFQQSQPTPPVQDFLDGNGWSPRPTQKALHPNLAAIQDRDLFERQAVAATCGFFDADINQPYTCPSGALCGYMFDPNYLACCPYDSSGSVSFGGSDCQSASQCLEWGNSQNGLSASDTEAVTTDLCVVW